MVAFRCHFGYSGTWYSRFNTFYGKPYITWEKVDNANLGFDLTLLNNRLTITADIYQRTTKDMIGPAEAIPDIGGIAVDQRAK